MLDLEGLEYILRAYCHYSQDEIRQIKMDKAYRMAQRVMWDRQLIRIDTFLFPLLQKVPEIRNELSNLNIPIKAGISQMQPKKGTSIQFRQEWVTEK